jgi:hypothetical protein
VTGNEKRSSLLRQDIKLGHYDNTSKDFTYNINDCNITYNNGHYLYLIIIENNLTYNIKLKKTSHLNQTAHLKNVNNCLNTSIYSYLETSNGQISNVYLIVHFFNTSLN